MSSILGLAALAAAAMSSSASGPPPLAPQADETPASLFQPAPPCSDALRRIAFGLGGELEDMRLTISPTWGLIWRGRLQLGRTHERAVVCVWRTVVLDAPASAQVAARD